MRIWPGNPYPLGATWNGSGVNFALFSEYATRVDLCLFDDADAKVWYIAHRLLAEPNGSPWKKSQERTNSNERPTSPYLVQSAILECTDGYVV
jgi:pullulanase/glycogen debranching enzyme